MTPVKEVRKKGGTTENHPPTQNKYILNLTRHKYLIFNDCRINQNKTFTNSSTNIT